MLRTGSLLQFPRMVYPSAANKPLLHGVRFFSSIVPIETAVAVVIVNDSYVIMGRKKVEWYKDQDNDKLNAFRFPGGNKDKSDDSLIITANRELFEETGKGTYQIIII